MINDGAPKGNRLQPLTRAMTGMAYPQGPAGNRVTSANKPRLIPGRAHLPIMPSYSIKASSRRQGHQAGAERGLSPLTTRDLELLAEAAGILGCSRGLEADARPRCIGLSVLRARGHLQGDARSRQPPDVLARSLAWDRGVALRAAAGRVGVGEGAARRADALHPACGVARTVFVPGPVHVIAPFVVHRALPP
jgi:hypothetical protein